MKRVSVIFAFVTKTLSEHNRNAQAFQAELNRRNRR